MAKTFEIPAGTTCQDCETYDENFCEITNSYPLATEAIDNYGYVPHEFVCNACWHARIDQAIG